MNAEQKNLVSQFEGKTCFEFMGKDELKGKVKPAEFIAQFERNIHWLEDMVTETKRLTRAYELRNL